MVLNRRAKGKISLLALIVILVLIVFCASRVWANNKVVKILFLGNSITAYGKDPSIGWAGAWGMAASSKSNDYVHIIVKEIAPKEFKIKTLEGWESAFDKYELANLKEYKDFKPDILIYQSGENTPPALAIEKDYPLYVKHLIDYIGAPKSIIISEFWPEPVKYQMMKSLAKENNYEFADISKVMYQKGAMAVEQYGNTPVGMHPSDKGMQLIADEVLKHIKN